MSYRKFYKYVDDVCCLIEKNKYLDLKKESLKRSDEFTNLLKRYFESEIDSSQALELLVNEFMADDYE